MIGTFTGDYYQHTAVETERQVDEEVELFNDLKSAILQARTHQQQFISLLEKPKDLQEEYTNFLRTRSQMRKKAGMSLSFSIRK